MTAFDKHLFVKRYLKISEEKTNKFAEYFIYSLKKSTLWPCHYLDIITQQPFTCSKSTTETPKDGVKYFLTK